MMLKHLCLPSDELDQRGFAFCVGNGMESDESMSVVDPSDYIPGGADLEHYFRRFHTLSVLLAESVALLARFMEVDAMYLLNHIVQFSIESRTSFL